MASRKFTECYKVDGPGDPTQILLFASWKQIAARDGAMTIFHFAKSLDALKQAVSDSPALREKIDHTAFREARRAFRDRFKDFEPIRHAVAHSAELTKTPKDKESNSFSGSYASNGIHLTEVNMMISDTLINRTFTNTHEGKIVSYEISWENWKVLDRVVGNVFSLFPER